MKIQNTPVTMAWHVRGSQLKESQIWRIAVNIWNKELGTANKGWSSNLEFEEDLTTPGLKRETVRNVTLV